jgi:hypothetical protein
MEPTAMDTVTLTVEQAETLLDAASEYIKAVTAGILPAPENLDVLEDAGTVLCTELQRWRLWWR